MKTQKGIYYYRTYDAARAKYIKLQSEGKKVVLRRPINGKKMYQVKVI
jgi:hypothetical protein